MAAAELREVSQEQRAAVEWWVASPEETVQEVVSAVKAESPVVEVPGCWALVLPAQETAAVYRAGCSGAASQEAVAGQGWVAAEAGAAEAVGEMVSKVPAQ